MAEEIRASSEEEPANGGHDDDEDDDEGNLVAWSIPIALILGFVILAVAVTRKG